MTRQKSNTKQNNKIEKNKLKLNATVFVSTNFL